MSERVPEAEVFCYVGRKRCCGRAFFMSVDDGTPSMGVAEVIKDGDIIERVTLEEARKVPFTRGCDHAAPPPARRGSR